jgi:hypothetical protein
VVDATIERFRRMDGLVNGPEIFPLAHKGRRCVASYLRQLILPHPGSR